MGKEKITCIIISIILTVLFTLLPEINPQITIIDNGVPWKIRKIS